MSKALERYRTNAQWPSYGDTGFWSEGCFTTLLHAQLPHSPPLPLDKRDGGYRSRSTADRIPWQKSPRLDAAREISNERLFLFSWICLSRTRVVSYKVFKELERKNRKTTNSNDSIIRAFFCLNSEGNSNPAVGARKLLVTTRLGSSFFNRMSGKAALEDSFARRVLFSLQQAVSQTWASKNFRIVVLVQWLRSEKLRHVIASTAVERNYSANSSRSAPATVPRSREACRNNEVSLIKLHVFFFFVKQASGEDALMNCSERKQADSAELPQRPQSESSKVSRRAHQARREADRQSTSCLLNALYHEGAGERRRKKTTKEETKGEGRLCRERCCEEYQFLYNNISSI